MLSRERGNASYSDSVIIPSGSPFNLTALPEVRRGTLRLHDLYQHAAWGWVKGVILS